MGLLFKPHTVTHLVLSDSGRAKNWESARSIRCQITPMTQREVVERWGDFEVARPHMMLADLVDVQAVKEGDRFEHSDGSLYVVKAGPMKWNAIGALSCGQVLLEAI